MKFKYLLVMALLFLSIAILRSGDEIAMAARKAEDTMIQKIQNRITMANRPVRVAIVDTGLDLTDDRFSSVLCQEGHRDMIDGDSDPKDFDGHGTHIAGLIKRSAGDSGYCLMIIKYYDAAASGKQNLDREIESFRWAIEAGADIVNFSGGGGVFDDQEFGVIQGAPGVMFIAAAGNEGQDTRMPHQRFYPGSYDLANVAVVGNMGQDGHRVPSSNYGDPRITWEVGEQLLSTIPCRYDQFLNHVVCEAYMTGTSQATGVHTGKTIKRILKAL